jgi:hypothetical protein
MKEEHIVMRLCKYSRRVLASCVISNEYRCFQIAVRLRANFLTAENFNIEASILKGYKLYIPYK